MYLDLFASKLHILSKLFVYPQYNSVVDDSESVAYRVLLEINKVIIFFVQCTIKLIVLKNSGLDMHYWNT